MRKTYVYISSWKHFGTCAGLGLYEFDCENGSLKFVRMVNDISCNVSKFDASRGILYVSNETDKLPWTKVGGGGRILAYKVDRANGDIQTFCEQEAYAANPCQFSLDPTGRYMVLANHASHASVTKITKDTKGRWGYELVYDDAPLVLFPVDETGKTGDPLDIILRDGEGPLVSQQHSMLHSVEFDPKGDFFVVTDIGADRVYTFRIDYEKQRLVQTDMFCDIPGSTPRYCVFHPSLPYIYINHEGGGELDILRLRYDSRGRLEPLDRTLAVDTDFKKIATDEQQGLIIDAEGKYIYDCLRGPDEIAVFRIDQTTGAIERIQNQKVSGKWVRGCTLSPDGRYLIAMAMMSGDIEVFAVQADGTLVPTGNKAVQESCSWATFVTGSF